MRKTEFWCDNCGKQFDSIPFGVTINRLDGAYFGHKHNTILLTDKEFCSQTCLIEYLQRAPW